MALSLQNPDADDSDGWLAEINTTPLVDVMLVLLIIFLLTVPVVSASVQLKLPVQTAQQQDTSGDYVIVSVDAAGRLYLNDTSAPDVASLQAALAPALTRSSRPQLHIRADGDAPYASIAPIIDLAQGMGWPQISLLTEQDAASKARISGARP
jgi:biopolymer transport protein ExbD